MLQKSCFLAQGGLPVVRERRSRTGTHAALPSRTHLSSYLHPAPISAYLPQHAGASRAALCRNSAKEGKRDSFQPKATERAPRTLLGCARRALAAWVCNPAPALPYPPLPRPLFPPPQDISGGSSLTETLRRRTIEHHSRSL